MTESYSAVSIDVTKPIREFDHIWNNHYLIVFVADVHFLHLIQNEQSFIAFWPDNLVQKTS